MGFEGEPSFRTPHGDYYDVPEDGLPRHQRLSST
jgi:hypothetical protein